MFKQKSILDYSKDLENEQPSNTGRKRTHDGSLSANQNDKGKRKKPMNQGNPTKKEAENSQKRAAFSNRFVRCPVCNKLLLLDAVDWHMDNEQCKPPVKNSALPVQEPKRSPSTYIKAVQQEPGTPDKAALFDHSPNKMTSANLATLLKRPTKTIPRLDSISISPNRGEPFRNYLISQSNDIGVVVVDEFITEEEQHALAQIIDNDPELVYRKFNGNHSGCKWGVDCDLQHRKTYEATRPFPVAIQAIIDRIVRAKEAIDRYNQDSQIIKAENGWWPNEANAICYYRLRNDWLAPHVDNRFMSKGPIVNLCVWGTAYMTYTKEKDAPAVASKPQQLKVLLKPRSLQIMRGLARYHYTHEIRNDDFVSDKRVSLTFRYSPVTETGQTRPR